MPALNEFSICKVSTTLLVDMKTVAKTTLYTVPQGKTFYPTHVVIRDTTASLAGGTSYSFGANAGADTWRQTVDLSSMTTLATDYMVLDSNNTKYKENAAGDAFGISVVTGATAAGTATIDVFGYLV